MKGTALYQWTVVFLGPGSGMPDKGSSDLKRLGGIWISFSSVAGSVTKERWIVPFKL